MEPISRTTAAQSGLTHFFTGRACKNGHVAPRYVSTGGCTSCQSMFSRKAITAARSDGLLPAQRIHPDDRESILQIIDYYNAKRGLPPALRPGDLPPMPTAWEVYLQKQMRRPFNARPSLKDMKRAAGLEGIKVEYATMTEPEDTWSTRPLALPLHLMSASDPTQMAINEAHNARMRADAEAKARGQSTTPPDVAARKAEMARMLAADGYLPDELPT